MALALDAQDRLWIVWSGGGAIHGARSRSHGRDFGYYGANVVNDFGRHNHGRNRAVVQSGRL